MLPSKLPRTSRLSSASTRREDSLGAEHSPATANTNTSKSPNGTDERDPDNRDADNKSTGNVELDWNKFPKRGFSVKHWPKDPTTAPKNPKKRRRSSLSREPLLQENEFDPDLNARYTVEPAKWWDDTRRYRKFTIANETFRLNDTVLVKPDSDDPDAPINNWVAKVLEVRAASEQHVFLRVYWMYRPEDLPGGRRPYHGRNEVIASNTMQIIDALTVNGKAFVRHWRENDSEETLDAETLFWRQTFDCPDGGPTGTLSKLRTHCIDNAPYNPDTLLVNCPNCNKWLHADCIAKDALEKAYKEHNIPYPGRSIHDVSTAEENGNVTPQPSTQETPATEKKTGSQTEKTPKKGRRKSAPAKLKEEKKEDTGPAFHAEFKSEEDGKPPKVIIKDLRDGKEEVVEREAHCLSCHALIE